MPSVSKYLIQGSVKQHGVPKRTGDGTQIIYMQKVNILRARREHVVMGMQEQSGGF